jgi:hypothetical protein
LPKITGLYGYDLKRIMRTGTVGTIDNRNWELRDQRGPVKRLSQSRAIALDMESATIAANGFRFRVPYGTLLCVSDKPLHGELKLPGMATEFYKRQVNAASDHRHPRDGEARRNAAWNGCIRASSGAFRRRHSNRPFPYCRDAATVLPVKSCCPYPSPARSNMAMDTANTARTAASRATTARPPGRSRCSGSIGLPRWRRASIWFASAISNRLMTVTPCC